ncbi:MAG: DUF4186 domain-containing protein [Pirellulaceae bacterium]|nr:DUF4186 domain-containing protein [Pirellulaceae bacterium]
MGRDLAELFSNLARSRFRSSFALSGDDREYIQRKGWNVVLSHAADFVKQRLTPALPRNDGRQTPMKGHPVFVAQHATATCCRGCLAKWHGIEKGVPLSEDDVQHVLAVITKWLQQEIDTQSP